ncbi:MAG: hypothetical protein HKO54_06025 [Flavobacteriaceae bacterium]|nr:hypothetical protein [Flavobacteriaceae bacterium]
MKRFKYILLATIVAVGTSAMFTSCEDSNKFRFPELGNGGFVKFVFQPDFWDGLQQVDFDDDGVNDFSIVKYHIGSDPTTATFDALTEDPSGNVATYELFVRGTFDGAPEDPVAFKSTDSFPFDVSFTGSDMATLFSVPIETFSSGDEFFFTSRIVTTDGRVYTTFATACEECPESLEDDDGNPLPPGSWNGGTIDSVVLQGGDTGDNFLLPAIFYTVKYLEP